MTTESINLRPWPDDTEFAHEARSTEWSRRIRNGLITAAVVAAHGIGLYLAMNHASVVLATEGKPAGTVQVTLVAAQPALPVNQPEPRPQVKPQPKPVIKPVAEKPRKVQVLSSAAPSARTVAEAQQEKPKVEDTPPPVLQPPAPPAAAPARAAAAAPGPNLLDKPKEIDAGELKQLACKIPAPEYPAKAKRLQQEGTVVIKLTIGTSGAVSSADVARSSGVDSLDAAALASIRAGHCRPYTVAGFPQAVQATQPVAFNLDD
ncbi:energy transducer TonB [Paraburkholderia kururiensis]|uniref:energy transducer TonB n=1 Tax=Paraburkholderia kururiensis TaxID=984307 RepID=UPI0005A72F92|nr:energy transducer TonB [Paraburkholderia kururiensis]